MKLSIISTAVISALIAGGGVYAYFQYQNNNVKNLNAPLVLEHTSVGEITTQSTINLSNGVRSAVYSIELQANQLIKANVSGALRAQLSVLRDNNLIERTRRDGDCSSCSSTESPTNTMIFKAPQSGLYQIVVSGLDATAYGPFNLKLTELTKTTSGPIALNTESYDWAQGQTIAYTLHISEEGLYTIDLKAVTSGLDPFLTLKNAKGITLAQDDDGGSNLNAQISHFLSPGEYVIQASSAGNDGSFKGGITLSVNQQTLELETLELSRTGGELHIDGQNRTGLYIGQPVPFSFDLATPQLVTIQLQSDSLSGHLKVGPYQSRQKDGGIQQVRAQLAAGKHTLVVQADNQTGLYDLSAVSNDLPAPIKILALEPNQTVHQRLSPQVDADSYLLTISTAGRYNISLDADQFDTLLQLLQNNELIQEDDDSGGNLNSQIQTWLEPGQYQVIVTSYDEQPQTFPYQLKVTAE